MGATVRCSHQSEKSQNAVNPLLGGVPVGWGGLVSNVMTNPPLPLPRGDLMNRFMAKPLRKEDFKTCMYTVGNGRVRSLRFVGGVVAIHKSILVFPSSTVRFDSYIARNDSFNS
jgi:hypothetical protein